MVASERPPEPYRPTPSPPKKWKPRSTCFANTGTRALKPPPPPFLELLNAPMAEGVVDPLMGQGVVLDTPVSQGKMRSRYLVYTPNTSKWPQPGSNAALNTR